MARGIHRFILSEEKRDEIYRYFRNKSRSRLLHRAFRNKIANWKDLHRVCIEYAFPVTCPLVLISQIQRSGGTLLSQLFDGHHELHAHPYELKIGFPKKYIWPRIDMNTSPEKWFETLFEDEVIRLFTKGYRKGQQYDETFPFILIPSLQRDIFINYVSSIQSMRLRDVFDGYMTSYFNAWINNQNRSGRKRFVTAFTPRMANLEINMEAFFQVYPDGRVISIIRDPKNWYPSARRHKPNKYSGIQDALNMWKENAEAMIRNKDRYGDAVCIIRFEDLITHTEAMMRYLAGFLDIAFDPILLEPTFNKMPIKANTSFKLDRYGIMSGTVHRHKTLDTEEIGLIDTMTGEIYREVLNRIVRL